MSKSASESFRRVFFLTTWESDHRIIHIFIRLFLFLQASKVQESNKFLTKNEKFKYN